MQSRQDLPLYAIVGTGATGLSCARFLRDRGMPFLLLDSRVKPPAIDTVLREFDQADIILGELPAGVLAEATHLIVSPGVSLDQPAIQQALAAGVELSSDLDLFRQQISGRLVCITGSNGKSTVATLVAAMAERAGLKTSLCGNIGVPVLDTVADEAELYVVEVSSFQLERCADLRADVAVCLNVSADHMDRYSSLQSYAEAKARVYAQASHSLFNRDDANSPRASGRAHSFGTDAAAAGYGLTAVDGREYLQLNGEAVMPVDEVRLRGRHNILNALAALAVTDLLGLPLQPLCEELRLFAGLPHRCEWLADINGVSWINDSKGTNVGATVAALQGFCCDGDAPNIVLIAGGVGKGADFTELKDCADETVRALIVFGQDGAAIAQAVSGSTTVSQAGSLEQAVLLASEQAQPGDTVLFSPACASFDMFANFEQRGDAFRAAVDQLQRSGGRP